MAKAEDIKSQEDLKKYLAEQEAAREAEKLAFEKKMDEAAVEAKALQEQIKKQTEELDQVKSRNWASKFDDSKTKEETLYNAGHYIKGILTGNRELVQKFGVNAGFMDKMKSMEWLGGKEVVPMQKDAIGTPLYSDATTGSYLVPVEYSGEVSRIAKQTSQMMGRVREIPMRGITKYVPYASDTATCDWLTAQSSSKGEVNPTFARTTLTSQTMGIYSSVVDEFDEDSLVNIAAYFRDIFGEAWGYEFDYQCTSASADPFTGMLNGAANVLTLGAGQTAFGDIGFDDFSDAIGELTTENARLGAVWIMHCTVKDIVRKIKDANGNYIYQKPEGGEPGNIWGYPVVTCDAMTAATSTAAGTKFIVFGNPKYFLWGNRIGATFKVFDNTYARATDDQILFQFRARAAFAIDMAGAATVAIRTAAS